MALTNATTLADYGAGIGTQGTTLKVDATNKRVGVGTTNPQGPEGSLQVGTGITFFGNTGIVSAIGGKFSGDFTVGGTLTYEDVSNIDAVGIITAQSHVSIADSILHTGDTDTAIRFPATDTFTVETAGEERLRVTSNGNIGIGTDDPGAPLQITADSPGILFEDQNSGYTESKIEGSSGHLFFTTANANRDHIFNATGGSESVRITGDGLVGIGTNDPSRLLELAQSNSTAYSTTDFDKDYHVLKLRNYTNDKSVGMQFLIGGNGEAAITAHEEDADGSTTLAFGVRGSGSRAERLRIFSGGQVAIATVTNYGNANCDDLIVGNRNSNEQGITIGAKNQGQIAFADLAGDRQGLIHYQHTDDSMRFMTNGASNERLRITGIGSVGIGENDPKRLLDVFNSSNTTYTAGDFQLKSTARLHNDSTTTDSFASLAFRTGSADNAIGFKYTGSANQADFILVNDGGSNGVERLRVASDGDVGIGTDNPLTAVHILSTNTGGDLTVERDGNGSAGPEIVLRHTSTSPADDDYVGQIAFSGRDDANNNTTVVRIDGVMTDVTNGSEDGELVFNTRNDGTFAERMRITSDGHLVYDTNGGGIYNFDKACSANASTNIFSITNDHGAHCFTIYMTGSNSGNSVSKIFNVACQFNANPVISSAADTGAFSGNNFTLTGSSNQQSHTFAISVTGDATTISCTVVLGSMNTSATVSVL